MADTLINSNKLSNLIDEATLLLLQAKEGEANKCLDKMFDELLILSSSFDSSTVTNLSKIIPIMYDAQQRRDHVYLVDILKYELPKYIQLPG
ncbi:MAG: TFIIF-interacting CTD phosphatase-like protein [Francisellaceae bacterium]|jgi:TFIIF-interacting CTD phosphatase-like protein